MAQLMFKIANEPPVDILTYNPNLPPAVVEVVNRALAKNAEERFQTGDEMAAAIRAAASGGGGDAAARTTTVDFNL
jgi:serine/threonine-protein kinase